jgi:hypothetical protein
MCNAGFKNNYTGMRRSPEDCERIYAAVPRLVGEEGVRRDAQFQSRDGERSGLHCDRSMTVAR